ncbi:MAG: hypothetical protein K2K13_06550 [Clostridiales bacterium]|nr:hypothetical protein [Clostridiales bacterium]
MKIAEHIERFGYFHLYIAHPYFGQGARAKLQIDKRRQNYSEPTVKSKRPQLSAYRIHKRLRIFKYRLGNYSLKQLSDKKERGQWALNKLMLTFYYKRQRSFRPLYNTAVMTSLTRQLYL